MLASGRMAEYVEGVHLRRTEENRAEIDALASLLGGRVGLRGVLADLNRRGRSAAPLPFWPPGRAVHRAFTWDREDRFTRQWYPQGISTSADASGTEDVEGRRMLAVTWYAKDLGGGSQGSRVSFIDLEDRRYRHVLLVVPRIREDGSVHVEPLRIHAGGVVWAGDHLHVAATSRGFVTFRLDDLMRVPDALAGDPESIGVAGGHVSSYGHRYLLPARFAYRAYAADGHEKLRHSFLSLDRAGSPPQLVAGEYAENSDATRRLAHYPLDPATLLPEAGEDGISRPLLLDEGGVARTQGAVVAREHYYLTVSMSGLWPGTVYVGRPGSFRRYLGALPPGPEDIAWWPSTDELWSLTEHPARRWVFCMRRGWFDR